MVSPVYQATFTAHRIGYRQWPPAATCQHTCPCLFWATSVPVIKVTPNNVPEGSICVVDRENQMGPAPGPAIRPCMGKSPGGAAVRDKAAKATHHPSVGPLGNPKVDVAQSSYNLDSQMGTHLQVAEVHSGQLRAQAKWNWLSAMPCAASAKQLEPALSHPKISIFPHRSV